MSYVGDGTGMGTRVLAPEREAQIEVFATTGVVRRTVPS
jgi:hypothetical protein